MWSSNFVYCLYDYRLNWTPLSPITVTYMSTLAMSQESHLLLLGMTQSASILKSGAHSFRFLGSQKLPCFFNFPVSHARPEKLCDFYWLQLQITCKLGWIAQAEKRYCMSKEGNSKLTAQRRTKTQGCALDLMAQDLALGDLLVLVS